MLIGLHPAERKTLMMQEKEGDDYSSKLLGSQRVPALIGPKMENRKPVQMPQVGRLGAERMESPCLTVPVFPGKDEVRS